MNTNSNLSNSVQNKFNKIQHQQLIELITIISNEFSLNNEEVLNKCLPKLFKNLKKDENSENSEKSKKSKKSKKSEKISDFKDATCLDSLKVFKINELKKILKENNKPISGSKKILMQRVWDMLNFNEETKTNITLEENEETKTNITLEENEETKTNITLEENEEIEEISLDPSCMPNLYTNNGIKIDNEQDSDLTLKLYKNRWLFIENDDELDYKGELLNDNKIIWSDEPSKELLIKMGINLDNE